MEKAMKDLVRKYIPNASDTMCEFVLWERIKSYPKGSPEQIEKEIREYATGYPRSVKGGGAEWEQEEQPQL